MGSAHRTYRIRELNRKKINMAITPSPKHGSNPTKPVCFFCGKHKNDEIVLLGQISGNADLKAPEYAIVDYEPCLDCKENMSKGIALIAVSTVQPDDGRKPLKIDKTTKSRLYPTGSWCVIKEEAASMIFDKEMAATVLEKRMCMISQEMWDHLFSKDKKPDHEENTDQKTD